MFAWTETTFFIRICGENQLLKDVLSIKFGELLRYVPHNKMCLAPLAQLANSQLINKTFLWYVNVKNYD